ncbi:MAG TPA: HYR domain-containing protein [Chryseosolibacter sp.]
MASNYRGAFLFLAMLLIGISSYGQACNCPPVASCGPCQGGMTRLTFRFHDSRVLQLFAADVSVSDGGGEIFRGPLRDGDTFIVDRAGNLFEDNELTLVVDLLSVTTITTSCATPIFVGDQFGDFEVISGRSMNNTAICCAASDMETVPPSITCPPNISVSTSSGCTQLVEWDDPLTSDNCGTVTLGSTRASGSQFAIGVTTVTYTATDRYGNSSSCSFTVTVNDGSNPVINNPPQNITINADDNACGKNVSWTAPTASDNCATGLTLTSTKNPGDFFPVGTTAVTYTARDGSGRQVTHTFNVVVNDATSPVITGCPGNMTVNADAAAGTCGANVTWTAPTASDNCSSGFTFTSNKNPGDRFPVGTTVVTYTARDAGGRQTTCSFNVVVVDATSPVVSGCPSNITVNADASPNSCGTVVNWTAPTASDNCTTGLTFTSNRAPGQSFSVGTTAVTYTARDAAGNQTTCTFNVTVKDVTLPTFANCPTSITVNASPDACNAIVPWTAPTVSDNCSVTVANTHNPGSAFSVGTTTVTYTATDGAGNQATCSFNVIVKDVTKPVVTSCPSNISLTTATCGAAVSWTPPTATDICGVTLTSNFAPGATFPVGTTAVTYTATDPSGNSQTCTFNVTVVDNVLPVIAGCNTGTIQVIAPSNSCNAVATWTLPTASDNCSVVLTSTHNPGATFPVGMTDVTYTATDPSGNKTTCTFKVHVRDQTLPVFSGCIATPITVNATTACGATVNWTAPTASDNCSATVTSTHSPGTSFPIGTTLVTYTAEDPAGNIAQCTFNVVVIDNSAPIMSGCPANIQQSLTGAACNVNVSWTPPTFTDNCAVTVTSTHSPGDQFALGTTTVTYTAQDPSNNTKTCSFNVIVTDASPPVISNCPVDITLTASSSCNATATWTAPTFTDNCSATMVGSHTPGQNFPVGSTTVTYTVKDGSNNQSTCSFKVTVVDSTLPVIQNCPTDITVAMDVGACSKTVTWALPTASDNCSVALTSNFPSGYNFPEGTTVVTYTAVDGSGNVATCSFNVIVRDQTLPVLLTTPSDISVTASASCSATADWAAPTFSDNCGPLTITSTHNPNTTFNLGETIVTYTAKDPSGNTTTSQFKVNVVDTTKPVISKCSGNIIASATEGCNASVTWAPPTASDNCQVTMTSTHQPGATFPLGATVVTYTAMDAAGNSSTCSFTVSVVDDTAPVFTNCPTDLIVSAGSSCAAPATWTAPSVSDCSDVITTSTHSPGDIFPVGSTVVTYIAKDLNGKIATCSFTVVVQDQRVPEFSGCPSAIIVDATTGCDAPVSWTPPIATDNCGIASLTSSHEPGLFSVGITTVTYQATDVHGNVSTCEFTVTVRNQKPPVISNCPADQTLKITYEDGAVASWTEPFASVQCGEVTLTSTYASGHEFPLGETLVEYRATDDAGNSSTCSFLITVAYEELEIDVTKLLTPDGDGINDSWELSNLGKFRENKVTIFDRWGGVVYAASGYNNQTVVWKGENASGGTVPTGTYFYTITVRFREDYLEKKGFIEVVR